MPENQSTLGDYAPNDASTDPDPDSESGEEPAISGDWGVEHVDIHTDEFEYVVPGVTRRECVHHGVAFGTQELIAAQLSMSYVQDNLAFHPDDQYREDQYAMEEEDPGAQQALENQHDDQDWRI